jgi:hypothetical protein
MCIRHRRSAAVDRECLFTGPYARTPHRVSFDVSPHDQNFLMLRSRDDEGRPTQINVMVNWFAALRRVFASR